MKKVLTVIAMLAVIIGAAEAGDISGYGSYWNTDELDETWGAGARLRIGAGKSPWLEIRGTYFDDLTEDSFTIELETIPVDIGFGFNILPDENLNVYLAGGGTYYFLDTDSFDVDDQLGWYAGAGADFVLSDHISIFAEFMYRGVEATVEDDDLDMIEDDADIDMNGTVVNVGLVFK